MSQKKPNARTSVTPNPLRRGSDGKLTRLYRIWIEMRSRCMNPKRPHYNNYGGRGITVCERWASYQQFHKDMFPSYRKHLVRHMDNRKETTLERINNEKGYSPENCRWTTQKWQTRNTTKSVYYEFRGERKTLAEWAEVFGIKYTTLYSRLHAYSIPIEKALLIPVSNKNRTAAFL